MGRKKRMRGRRRKKGSEGGVGKKDPGASSKRAWARRVFRQPSDRCRAIRCLPLACSKVLTKKGALTKDSLRHLLEVGEDRDNFVKMLAEVP